MNLIIYEHKNMKIKYINFGFVTNRNEWYNELYRVIILFEFDGELEIQTGMNGIMNYIM